MDDKTVETMVMQHDKHLDSRTSCVKTLADSVGTTNKKLDNVIEVISTQNVMVERMNNMDVNMKEFAKHIRARVSTVETHQDTMVSGTVIRWGTAIAIMAMLSMLTFVNTSKTGVIDSIHALDKVVVSRIEKQSGINHDTDRRVIRLEGKHDE